MSNPIASRVLAAVLAGVTVTAFAQSEAPPAQRTIREASAPTGSSVRRQLIAAPYPLNLRYDQMSAADKRLLHESWESIPEGDEPPFPAKGLRELVLQIYNASGQLKAEGPLRLVATVGPTGEVQGVKAYGAPGPEMARIAGQLLMLTPFKPAVCSGKPCTMEFPLSLDLPSALPQANGLTGLTGSRR